MTIDVATKSDLEEFKNDILEQLSKLMEAKSSRSNRWLRSNDVCEMLNISQSTLQNYRVKGILKPSKVSGTVFYDVEEIEKLLKGGSS